MSENKCHLILKLPPPKTPEIIITQNTLLISNYPSWNDSLCDAERRESPSSIWAQSAPCLLSSSSSSCQIMSWIFIPRVWEVWGNPEQLTWFCEWKNTIKTGLRVNGSWVTALYAQKSRNFFRVAGSRHLHHIVSCHKRDWWTQFSVRFPFPLLPSLMSSSIMHENAQSEEKTRNWKFSRDFEI